MTRGLDRLPRPRTNLGYDGVFVMCAAASLAAMAIYGFMYLRLRRLEPALADAS